MIFNILFIAYNFIVFAITAFDKFLAKQNKWRIPEKTLLLLALFGGTIGAITAMIMFRHKIAKSSYLIKFSLIVIVQIIAYYFYKKGF